MTAILAADEPSWSAQMRTHWLILLIAVTLCTTSCGDSGMTAPKGYEPAAKVTVEVGEGGAGKLVGVLQAFCNTEGLELVLGEVPRKGRAVVQAKIIIADSTFFYGDNFLSEGRFMMGAYSHGGEDIWRNKWNRLLEELASTFGRETVTLD